MENPIYIRMLISLVEQDVQDEVRVKAFHAISSESLHNKFMFSSCQFVIILYNYNFRCCSSECNYV